MPRDSVTKDTLLPPLELTGSYLFGCWHVSEYQTCLSLTDPASIFKRHSDWTMLLKCRLEKDANLNNRWQYFIHCRNDYGFSLESLDLEKQGFLNTKSSSIPKWELIYWNQLYLPTNLLFCTNYFWGRSLSRRQMVRRLTLYPERRGIHINIQIHFK